MNNTITAQELKTKGASILKNMASTDGETFITVRGEKSYVVLTMDKYNFLRECELEAALKQAESDIAEGKFNIQSVEEHIKDVQNV